MPARAGRAALKTATQSDDGAEPGSAIPPVGAPAPGADAGSATCFATVDLAERPIAEVWRTHPAAPEVFAAHHLPACIHCPLSATETVAEGAALHGADAIALVAALEALGPPIDGGARVA
jgi:hybrid cluster-associated redox disulfide protein